MGTAFASRLIGFGVDVLAYDKYKRGFSDARVRESDMPEIFERTDILSLHVPLTEETRNLVGKTYLDTFSKDIFLINTARGPVVNTADLVAAMQSGKVRGACLDVLEYENTAFSGVDGGKSELEYLLQSDRTILSPHVAGWSVESEIKLSAYLADKIIARFG
jgi:D-3-phosphoglycerate dehydrogenase